jgi:UDP-N-acetylglucosamine/UDP-N-acetylgalactosamine diphosphorylase
MATLETNLSRCGQAILLEALNKKNLAPSILEDLETIDWEKIEELLELIKSPQKKISSFQPIVAALEPAIHHPADMLKGIKLGCLVMAGGQATRLNGSLPKGLIPVSPLTHKPTLQLIAEKVLAFSRAYKTDCFLGIMASDASQEKIEKFFSSNNYFGLKKETVSLFKQESLPALDEGGQLIIKNDRIFKVPDGNGGIFTSFTRSAAFNEWKNAGVKLLSIINNDNPLIDPFLPNLFLPLLQGIEMTAAAVERSNPQESVGLFVQKGDKKCVAEYSEIDPLEAQARDPSNNLLYKWANISFFACTLDACVKASKNRLPLHIAKKSLNGDFFWKGEYFVFDHCLFMSSFNIVPISREFFAPIKTLQGPSSPEAVGQILLERDKKRFSEIYKKPAPSAIELQEEVYYSHPHSL